MSSEEIILIEDDELLLRALERTLTRAGYRVTGLQDAEQLIGLMEQQAPAPGTACVLMDVNLGELNGIDAQRLLKERAWQIPVVFMSGDINAQNVNQAWREGASNFLFKPFSTQELLDSLRQALEKSSMSDPARDPQAAATLERLRGLTVRQQQILPLLAQGLTHAQIAAEVGISSRTVKMHRAAIMQRLGLSHVTDLARFHEACKALPETTCTV